jgi:hypothetical protein
MREKAFAHLLLPAFHVEFDQLHHPRIMKVGHVRIVKGNMAIFADAQAAKIDGLLFQQVAVTLAFVQGQQRIALQIVTDPRSDILNDALAQKPPETGLMLWSNSQVLVHVKDRNPGPVEARQLGQRLQEFHLRRGAGENDCCRSFGGDRFLKTTLGGLSGVQGQFFRSGKDTDAQLIGRERFYWNRGCFHILTALNRKP